MSQNGYITRSGDLQTASKDAIACPEMKLIFTAYCIGGGVAVNLIICFFRGAACQKRLERGQKGPRSQHTDKTGNALETTAKYLCGLMLCARRRDCALMYLQILDD